MPTASTMKVPNHHRPTTLSIRRPSVQNHPAFDDHEQVLFCHDAASDLKAIIAIHSTKLGSALGGCRMWPYASENEALTDVLRLSQGMSYEHAVAETGRGGGKAVIIGDPKQDKTPELLRAFGCFVDELAGRYITAEDVGVAVDDMVVVHEETEHVAGLPVDLGGSGDPSPFTAYGVFCGIKAAAAFQTRRKVADKNLLDGVKVAVQGLGHVGYSLCEHLADANADLVVTDINARNLARVCDQFGATPVEPNAIYDVGVNVFAPCALGAVLTPETVDRLKATIVAGAANNQLAGPDVADLLHDRAILYAPDYVANAGGIINISQENENYNAAKAKAAKEAADKMKAVNQRGQQPKQRQPQGHQHGKPIIGPLPNNQSRH